MNNFFEIQRYTLLKYSILGGFATTHVVDFLWVFKTSYHLLIFPPPTNLPNSLPSPYHSKCHAPQQQRVTLHWREIKLIARVECVARIHATFLLTVQWIKMFFNLKHSASKGESSLKISAYWSSPFRRSKGTNIQQTDLLTDWCFYRVISPEIKITLKTNKHELLTY